MTKQANIAHWQLVALYVSQIFSYLRSLKYPTRHFHLRLFSQPSRDIRTRAINCKSAKHPKYQVCNEYHCSDYSINKIQRAVLELENTLDHLELIALHTEKNILLLRKAITQ